jgi:quercetin dioxygenase-like cupin family protein
MSEMKHFCLNQIETKKPFEGAQARFIHSDNMTLACWQFDQGAVLPEHSHPHEQITNVMGGSFELTVDGETLELEAGSVVVIPPNANHSGRAKTGCYVMDVFYPVRDDYR